MARAVTPINLGQQEIRNAAIQNLSAAPSSPVVGQLYFNTATGALMVWNGTAWGLQATNSLQFNGNLPAYYLSRSNHTGTQLSSTISDLSTVVQAYPLSSFSVPTSSVPFNNQRITGLADPQSAQDAATQNWVVNQVQASAAGIDSKPSVRVIAVNSITLSGTQTIDGVTLNVGDRVLVTAQSDGTTNGVYAVSSGAWSRTTDANLSYEITPGAFWFVEEGTTYGKTQWRCNNTGTVTLGSTSITIVQFGAANLYTASTGVQLTGQNFTAQVVNSGGILAGATGLYVDTTLISRKIGFIIGDGSSTTFNVNHNLGTRNVNVTVYANSGIYDDVLADVSRPTSNQVTIGFGSAPATNSYNVVIQG